LGKAETAVFFAVTALSSRQTLLAAWQNGAANGNAPTAVPRNSHPQLPVCLHDSRCEWPVSFGKIPSAAAVAVELKPPAGEPPNSQKYPNHANQNWAVYHDGLRVGEQTGDDKSQSFVAIDDLLRLTMNRE
jgi:hypothetical protein